MSYMDCKGCIFASTDIEAYEWYTELLYEDFIYCLFLEEIVIQSNEQCVYKKKS